MALYNACILYPVVSTPVYYPFICYLLHIRHQVVLSNTLITL